MNKGKKGNGNEKVTNDKSKQTKTKGQQAVFQNRCFIKCAIVSAKP